LTTAAARNPKAEVQICFDERGAAFFALGFARATNMPAVLICTSGTALANYFPAVIEASKENVPMIILSADRPPELRDTGANQTIDQVKIFDGYVRWQVDFPCPDEKIKPEFVLSTIDQAVYRAINNPQGPVHLNCMFREPLAPSAQAISENYLNRAEKLNNSNRAFTKYFKSVKSVDKQQIIEIGKEIESTQKGILAVGKLTCENEIAAVKNLSEKLNWPVFADIRSGLRTGFETEFNITFYDQLLSAESFCRQTQPELILHIGGGFTSKRFYNFIKKYPSQKYIRIANHPYRDDPVHAVDFRIESSIEYFCAAFNELQKGIFDEKWLEYIIRKNREADKIIGEFVSKERNVSEISLARYVSENIFEGRGLFLASSMPVRDMDMYAVTKGNKFYIAANRGASGIDGTIVSAAGFAKGLKIQTTLITGDLAFLHDMNSLTFLDSDDISLIIIVINNKGGGIFSFLPIAKFEDVFQKYFETPHNYSFSLITEMFGLEYYNPKYNYDFVEIYNNCQNSNKSVLIEINTDTKENFSLHKQLQNKIISETG